MALNDNHSKILTRIIQVNDKSHNTTTLIKKCPYCKSDNISDKYTFIQCNNCNARGPQTAIQPHADHIDHMRAIKEWNRVASKSN
jgi:hypothetical protein